ncbi:substrate-binding domain-containing protein [Herbiconiux sp. CPCC 205763]|uniref:Substrate-binding domain-containing protein n=1 Tax=Herbiconiux aconitum TaxID=2970913 RepID=A0ABT2GMQ6_9MICO|nr:substrate-binding domain-containing protein [Herbiconiux aconitum]MCS5717504.1 substrate-binding domain-containing protein [Herbiconiux aconitum]
MAGAAKRAAERTTTLAEIAAAAGVSVPTVSRVLNGKRGISESKRTAIEKLLDERGYERRKSRREMALIDFVISSLDTQWATELLRGAQAEAAREGADLVITVTDGHPAGTPDWIERLTARGTDGVVLVVSELADGARDELSRLQVPVVLIDPVGTDTESYVTVAATDWAGGRDATEHLLGLGHTRIGFITGPLVLECHQDRLDGYFSALGRARVATDSTLVREGNSLTPGGQKFGGELLDLPDRPTAIISGSDEQAYGVYLAARERGIRIPEDLSIVGFDDVDLCQWVTPQLTTVRQPLAGMAAEATRLLLTLSRGDAIANPRVQLASELVVRDSTSAPGAAQRNARSTSAS